jgi:phosphatidylglycerol---prolipoprotein diacylglyceryl transferase
MLVHPNIDPVALKLGPLKVHWYGLMYLLGFWGAWWLGTIRARWPHVNWPRERVGDLLFYGVLGVIVGGRTGYMLFYAYDAQGWTLGHDPLAYFRIWDGGMSFHGGLVGVIVAMMIFARQIKLSFWEVADFAAVFTPFGLFTGRIGNFINGELWGAPTTLPWGMVFPRTAPDNLPRHPSMLYEAGLEGLVLLAILWVFARKPRPMGATSGLFLLGYGVFRFAIEFVRMPDKQLGYLYGTSWFTMGMQLCVPMILCGAGFIWMAYKRNRYAVPATAPGAA